MIWKSYKNHIDYIYISMIWKSYRIYMSYIDFFGEVIFIIFVLLDKVIFIIVVMLDKTRGKNLSCGA